MIRRLDGTIKTIFGVPTGASEVAVHEQAITVAEQLDLDANVVEPIVVNRHLSSPPKVMLGIRRRHRGRSATPGQPVFDSRIPAAGVVLPFRGGWQPLSPLAQGFLGL